MFTKKESVVHHEDGKHPTVPGQFKCEICGKGINSKYFLYEHLRKTHKVDAKGNPIQSKPSRKEEIDELEEKKRVEQRKRAAHVQMDGKWKCRHCEKSKTCLI